MLVCMNFLKLIFKRSEGDNPLPYGNKKLRVVCILPSLHAGGAENYMLRLIRFSGNGVFEWHVLSPNLERGDLHDAFQEIGVSVRYQKIGYVNPYRLLHLYRYLKSGKFDAICSLNGVFGGLSLAVAKVAGIGVRVGWHRRSTPAFKPSKLRGVYAKFAVHMLEMSSTRILSNSRAALDYFHGPSWETNDKFGIVPNGIDAGLFLSACETRTQARDALGIPIESYVVGHVGRYDPAKNHETIFRVAAELIRQMPNVTFVFCGRGTDLPPFKQQLDRFGISGCCVTLGLQDDLPRVYRSFDVFYFPSVTEGQPNALIEAVLSRVPLVTVDIPGIKQALPPWYYPKLLPALDVEQAVEALLIQLHPSQSEILTLSEWARDVYDLKKNMSLSLKEFLNTNPGFSNYA